MAESIDQEVGDRASVNVLGRQVSQSVAEVDHGRVGEQDSGHRRRLRSGAMAIRMLDESEITDEGRRLRAELEAEGERLIQERLAAKRHLTERQPISPQPAAVVTADPAGLPPDHARPIRW